MEILSCFFSQVSCSSSLSSIEIVRIRDYLSCCICVCSTCIRLYKFILLSFRGCLESIVLMLCWIWDRLYIFTLGIRLSYSLNILLNYVSELLKHLTSIVIKLRDLITLLMSFISTWSYRCHIILLFTVSICVFRWLAIHRIEITIFAIIKVLSRPLPTMSSWVVYLITYGKITCIVIIMPIRVQLTWAVWDVIRYLFQTKFTIVLCLGFISIIISTNCCPHRALCLISSLSL